MILGINTTPDITKLSQISLAYRLVKLRVTILKYHSWYLCQISLQIMLLPIPILPRFQLVELFYYEKYIYHEKSGRFPQNGGNWCGSPPGFRCVK